jgi:hypothetical protein
MRVMNDGFVYKVVSGDKARQIFDLNLFELYILWIDDSESLIETHNILNEAIEGGYDIGISVGNINNK